MIQIEPLDFEINPLLITEGFTQSEMQSWDNCSEYWYLRYNQMLVLKGALNWPGYYGKWCHAAWEEWYTTKGKRWTWNPEFKKEPGMNQKAIAEYDYWSKLGRRQMEIYVSHYKQDHKIIKPYEVEAIVDIEFEGFRLKGMIDLPCHHKGLDEDIIIDHKTSSRLDKAVMMGWDFRFQFMFYLWIANRNPDWRGIKWGGFMPNGMKKPQLRRTKGESVDSFVNRVGLDMQNRPEMYFYRSPMLLKKGDMKHFEDHILRPKLMRLRILLDPKVPKSIKLPILRNKNTDYCVKYGTAYACPYLPLCQGGQKNRFLFKKRDVKHVELEDDGDES